MSYRARVQEELSLRESAVDVSGVPEHYQVVEVARAAALLEPEDNLPGLGFGLPGTPGLPRWSPGLRKSAAGPRHGQGQAQDRRVGFLAWTPHPAARKGV